MSEGTPETRKGSVDHFKDDHSEIERYHESTKLTPRTDRELGRRIGAVSATPALLRMITRRNGKSYAAAPRLQLPPAALGDMTVEQAIRARRSQTGAFTGEPIDLAALSAILRFSFGPTASRPVDGVYPLEGMHLRGTASGGGVHAAEIYPVVLGVRGCPPGIYHYDVRRHQLELLAEGEVGGRLAAALADPEPVRSSAVTLVLTAVMHRNLAKYLHRGYRFVSYDQGCLLQSLYLTATALGLGSCAVGGFFDDEVGRLLGIDNLHEHAMMLFALGMPAPGPLGRREHVAIDY